VTWVGCAAGTALLVASRRPLHLVAPGGLSLRDQALGEIALLGTALAIMAPGFAVAVLVRARRADVAFLGWLLVSSFFTLADALVYDAFGRHLWALWGYARADGGWEVAGGAARWFRVGLAQVLMAAACVAAGALPGRWVGRRPGSVTGIERRATMGILVAAATVVLTTALSSPLWASEASQESAFETFAVDIRVLRHPDAEWGQVSVLEAQLSTRLGNARDRLRGDARRACAIHGRSEGHLPNVLVVFVESFRTDVVTEELMPRLTRYARGGLRLDGHLAGSILSEAGLFALLFARNPLLYDWTLDGKSPPCATRAFSELGYTTAYFSGQPETWRRAEEFVNARTFHEYHHDDRGGWVEWDERALRGLTELARSSERPVFGVAYLMSSHFEYQFPPRYEIDRPAASASAWPKTDMRGLGAADAAVLRNRYRNSMRFLDDAIMNAIDQLDPRSSIVVVTGDHGESLYEDGRFGHGYSFADVIARTPAIIVGPGIVSGRRDAPSLHADLLPTLLSASTAGRVTLSGVDGRDLQAPAAPGGAEERDAVLLAADDVGRDMAIAELRSGDQRLDLQIRLGTARVTWDGMRDPLGKRQANQHLTPGLRQDLVRGFDSALRDMERD
jgi:arylsulfatase A-like enzyme